MWFWQGKGRRTYCETHPEPSSQKPILHGKRFARVLYQMGEKIFLLFKATSGLPVSAKEDKQSKTKP